MLGWGPKDQSTKEERDAWKDNAKSQMADSRDDSDESTDDTQPPRHARRKSW